MPATVIDGKALAAATKAEAAEKVRELKSRGINPCLAVILVGENPASQVYVRGKINDCAQCGIESRSINLPADTTQDALLAELSALDRVPLPRAEHIAMPRREPVRRVEHFDTTQAKLCMLFTLDQPMQPGQLAAVRLAMALYGGSVTSRLFLNVRERDHLCYYCSSSFQSFTGSMAVNSGVEHADAARAEQAVLKELADLCDGPITDEELEDCRRGLLAGMNGLEDTLGGIETWYYMEVLRGGPVQTPDDARRALLAVTREDVRDILKQFTLSVSCLLTREEGNGNG